MAYTLDFSLALGGGQTGLTLAAQLVDTAGSDVGSEVTTGFTEIGEGFYLWNYAAIPDDHRGGVKFYQGGVPGTILAFASVNPEEGEDVASILLDTGTDGVVIADDAITSAKYDESTAYPLASADSGSTEVARTGADSDTLETLSDEIAVVDGIVDAILVDTSVDGVVVATASKTGYALSTAGVDAILDDAVEGTYTLRQILRLLASVLAGESSGGGTATVTFRNLDDDTDRVVATVDTSGNRTAVTLDVS